MKRHSSDDEVLSRLYFRLLPYQVLLLVISAANGIVDSVFASNFIGKSAMSAIGFYSPLNHFLFAAASCGWCCASASRSSAASSC